MRSHVALYLSVSRFVLAFGGGLLVFSSSRLSSITGAIAIALAWWSAYAEAYDDVR